MSRPIDAVTDDADCCPPTARLGDERGGSGTPVPPDAENATEGRDLAGIILALLAENARLVDAVKRLRSDAALVVVSQRHYPGDDLEFCWRCERPWPCPDERAGSAAAQRILTPDATP
jgi:hypothetical protein